MEQGNQQAVSESTASSSQNSLTGGGAASSSQNSLTGSGAASSSKNSMTSGGGGKVAVTKRKRSVLTLERKQEIISEVKKGKSVRLVSGQFGVPQSTVNAIWKGRERIESYVSASECPSLAKRRCIIKDPNYEKLDQACHVWFFQQRSMEAPVSGPVLKREGTAVIYSPLS